MDDHASRSSRRTYLTAIGAAGIGALGGCLDTGALGGGDESTDGYRFEGWTTFRGDPANSGVRPADDGPGSSLSFAWKLDWEAIVAELEDEDPDEIEPSESAAEGVEGEALRNVEFSEPVLTSSGVVCSVGYRWYDPATETVSERSAAIGVDRSSGEIRWSHALSGSENAAQEGPVRTDDSLEWFGAEVVDDTVLVPTLTDSGVDVAVLEEGSGEPVDELGLGLSEKCGRPRVADGLLYVVDAADGPRLRAFDLESGDEEWATDVTVTPDVSSPRRRPSSGLSIANDLVWTVEHGAPADGEPTEVVARDAREGTEELREPIDLGEFRERSDLPENDPHPILGELCFGAEYAYAAGDHSSRELASPSPLVAVDPADGTERWRFGPSDLDSEEIAIDGLYGRPVAADGSVIVSGWSAPDGEGTGSYLFAVDESDGSLEWYLDIVHTSTPVVAGETIYLHTTTSAISLDGDRLDGLERPAPAYRSPPALGDGRLFVGGMGSLAAIE